MTAPDVYPDPEPVRLLDEILEEAIDAGAITGWSRIRGSDTYTVWHPDGPTLQLTVAVDAADAAGPWRLSELLADVADHLTETAAHRRVADRHNDSEENER